jgi:hypothetical protein
MFLQDIAQFASYSWSWSLGGANPVATGCAAAGLTCPGSSFTAIGAAFATEGYFVQSDIIHYLLSGPMGLWAPLLYLLAAAAGMVGVAMGSPPKTYMWFFLGPAFYHWLIATPEAVHGTEWRVADVAQDQREVWKLAEVGLVNTRIVKRLKYKVSSEKAPTGGPMGDGSVDVAWFFAFYDALISETCQWLVRWTGVYEQKQNDHEAGGTNIWKSNVGLGNSASGSSGLVGGTKWHLLSGLKWSLLEDITSATVHTADVRDAFISFMSSECGDELAKFIDKDKFVASQHAGGANTPDTIFSAAALDSGGLSGGANAYGTMYQRMANVYVPIIPSVRNLTRGGFVPYTAPQLGSGNLGYDPRAFATNDRSSLMSFLKQGEQENLTNQIKEIGVVNCATYFNLIIQAFRWEAGHIYYQMVTKKLPNLRPDEIVYGLFYGWGIQGCPSGRPNCSPNERTKLTAEQQMSYLKNLIFAYLIRNEMRLAPKIFSNPRFSNASKIEDYAKTHQRTVGEKSKYGEIYTWSNLVPYIQGILLYVLAMAYPLACLLIVVPGWHKTLFTWMSFWAWAKLWDVGFAVVMVIERSIWAMLGNSGDAKAVASRVVSLSDIIPSSFICNTTDLPNGYGNFTCFVPRMMDDMNPAAAAASSAVAKSTAAAANYDISGIFHNLMLSFDISLVISANLDLDLSNSYYIYIMAALYLSVPAVTGQLVLGAKSGVASMVGTMIGGVSSEAGRAAGSAFSSDMTQKAKSAGAALGQTGYLKGLRNSPATAGALYNENKAAYGRALGALNSGAREAMGQRAGIVREGLQTWGLSGAFTGEWVAGNSQAQGMVAGGLIGAAAATGPQLAQGLRGAKNIGGALASDAAGLGRRVVNGITGNSGGGAQVGAGGAAAQGSTTGAAVNASTASVVGGAAGTANANNGSSTASSPPLGSTTIDGSSRAFSAGPLLAQAASSIPGGISQSLSNATRASFNTLTDVSNLQNGMSAANYRNELQQWASRKTADSLIDQAGFSLEAGKFSAMAEGYSIAGNRGSAHAHFDGENSAWTDKNNYANDLAGDLAAMGVSAAVLDPGAKPTNFIGAVMSGALDSRDDNTGQFNDFSTMGHFANSEDGMFFSGLKQAYGDYERQMGEAALTKVYDDYRATPDRVVDRMSDAMEQTRDMLAARYPMLSLPIEINEALSQLNLELNKPRIDGETFGASSTKKIEELSGKIFEKLSDYIPAEVANAAKDRFEVLLDTLREHTQKPEDHRDRVTETLSEGFNQVAPHDPEIRQVYKRANAQLGKIASGK